MGFLGDIYGWLWEHVHALVPVPWFSFSLLPLLLILLVEARNWRGISVVVRLPVLQKQFAEQEERLDEVCRQAAAQEIEAEKEVSWHKELPEGEREKLLHPIAEWRVKRTKQLKQRYHDALGFPLNQPANIKDGCWWTLLRCLLFPFVLLGSAATLLDLEKHAQISGPVVFGDMNFEISPLHVSGALAWILIGLLAIRFIPVFWSVGREWVSRKMSPVSAIILTGVFAAIVLGLLYAPSGVLWIFFVWGLVSTLNKGAKVLWLNRHYQRLLASAEEEARSLKPPEEFFIYQPE
jgi:hypothetical protein